MCVAFLVAVVSARVVIMVLLPVGAVVMWYCLLRGGVASGGSGDYGVASGESGGYGVASGGSGDYCDVTSGGSGDYCDVTSGGSGDYCDVTSGGSGDYCDVTSGGSGECGVTSPGNGEACGVARCLPLLNCHSGRVCGVLPTCAPMLQLQTIA